MGQLTIKALAQAGQLIFVLAGAALLLRALVVPEVRRRWFQTNRLPHWHVTLVEVGMLLVFIFLCGFAGQMVLFSLFGQGLKGHPEHQGLQVLLAGAGFHGVALLGWPAWRHFRRSLHGDQEPALEQPAPVVAPGSRPVFAVAVGALLCALPAILLFQLGWLAVLEWLGRPADPQELIDIFANVRSPWLMAGLLVMACVVAPINEELIFRHGLYRFGRQRFGRPIALTASSLLFGASHFNLAGVVPLAVLGAALALAYEKSGDVRVPIVAHGLFNLNTICLIMLGVTQ